jgi:hypothetical protein
MTADGTNGHRQPMAAEWDPAKARANLRKQGILLGRAGNMRKAMKQEYDFSKGRRGAALRVPPEKTRVTIRLDNGRRVSSPLR